MTSKTNKRKREDAEAEKFLTSTEERIKRTVEYMDSRRRQLCLRQLETLRKIDKLFSELRASSSPLLEDSTLLVTQESRDEVLTRFEELYAITNVPHTVKKRNRDVFPFRGWGRPDEVPIAERNKFAERDRKTIERYKTEKESREKAVDVLNSARCSKKTVLTFEERDELDKLKTTIAKELDAIVQPESTRIDFDFCYIPASF